MSGYLSRSGGDRYADKRMVIAALIATIKQRKDSYFRGVAGIKAGDAVPSSVRDAVAKVEADKIYRAISKVFLNAVLVGGGLRLDGFGKIFLKKNRSEKEVRWLDDYGVHCYDPDTGRGAGVGVRKMYKVESTPRGYYAYVKANYVMQQDREIFIAAMVAAGWVDVGAGYVRFGPVPPSKCSYMGSSGFAAVLPWTTGTSSVPVAYERRIVEFGPGARSNMIWVCSDDEYGPACVVAVVYREVDGAWRVNVTR